MKLTPVHKHIVDTLLEYEGCTKSMSAFYELAAAGIVTDMRAHPWFVELLTPVDIIRKRKPKV